jgi:RNA polymerase sigma factor (sigma-70 family)
MKGREQKPPAEVASRPGESLMKNSLPDEELMFLVRNGVAEMLGVLFDRYHAQLFNFYCKVTGDRVASEDLVQDVFYRILKYRKTYQPGSSFRTWMYGIARNARLDHVKRQPPEVEVKAEEMPLAASQDKVQQDQEVSMLHRALMQLSEEKREVLVLSRFQDLKYEEIAQLQGCEVGAVKVRVHRALNELREIFQRLEGRHISMKQTYDGRVGS